jgi:photosystem II stability/assembly factor-like uncharacterized protein
MRSFPVLLLFLIPCFMSCQQAQEQTLFDLTYSDSSRQDPGKARLEVSSIVFQSTDGGQSWQDISAGLPKGLEVGTFSVGNDEIFLGSSKDIYRNSMAPNKASWEKEMCLGGPLTNVSAGSGSRIGFNNNCLFFQRVNETGVWMPVFADFKGQSVRSVFTAANGSIFIGCDRGIFKSADQGKTWKHVMQDGWMIQMVESDGVLICTNEQGILRSTDGGEHWDVVVSEGGVGIAVSTIRGGFAAITYNTGSKTRRIRISTDGGKNWQPIDDGLPPSDLISSILQVGDFFYCGHPKGIYRSADRGKTWYLLLPTIGEKVFNLSASGGVLYAVLRDGGC